MGCKIFKKNYRDLGSCPFGMQTHRINKLFFCIIVEGLRFWNVSNYIDLFDCRFSYIFGGVKRRSFREEDG